MARPGKKRILSPAQAAAMANDIAKGMTWVQAGKKYGIAQSTVRNYLSDRDARIAKAEKERARKPRKMKPCGTVAAYRRHLRNKEVPCEKCLEANRLYTMMIRYRDKDESA